MIDWTNLFLQALWVVGVSLLLANFSFQRWARQAQVETGSKRQQLIFKTIAFSLTGIGLIGVNSGIWLRLGWLLVTVLAIASEYLTYRDRV